MGAGLLARQQLVDPAGAEAAVGEEPSQPLSACPRPRPSVRLSPGAPPAQGQHELSARPCHRHVQQPPQFVQLRHRRVARELLILHLADNHQISREPLSLDPPTILS